MTNTDFSQPLATRDGFGLGLIRAAEKDPNIVALCADLDGSLRLRNFAKKFPQRFIQVGVAEQNLVGVAAGLALTGKKPFIASFASFMPGRTYEQIRHSIAYSNLNVTIVGGHAGLATGPDGATHQMLEDIAMMRAMPNMTVVQPCNAEQAAQATQALAEYNGPAYLRLSRPKIKGINAPKNFEIGQAQILKQGLDITLIASGIVVKEALEAAQELAQQGISARVINLHTIKPLDQQKIFNAYQETKAIVTIEDHQIAGGVGSAVSEVIASELGRSLKQAKPVIRIGVEDQFGESGKKEKLYEKYGLTKEKILEKIKKF